MFVNDQRRHAAGLTERANDKQCLLLFSLEAKEFCVLKLLNRCRIAPDLNQKLASRRNDPRVWISIFSIGIKLESADVRVVLSIRSKVKLSSDFCYKIFVAWRLSNGEDKCRTIWKMSNPLDRSARSRGSLAREIPSWNF